MQKIPDIKDLTDTPPPDRPWRQRALAGYILIRTLVLWASMAAAAIVVSSLVGARTESTTLRLCAGLYCAVMVPWTARAWLRSRIALRSGSKPRLGGAWFLTGFNAAVVFVICFGFSMDTGNALRRRGDWFLGEARGWFPRQYRAQLSRAAHWLETLDGTYRPPVTPLHPRAPKPAGPGRPAAVVKEVPWYHPLPGPRRVMPPNSRCRFGALRHGNRPPECERGHCGVDLFLPEGTPVHAVHEGVVYRMQRDAAAGGRAGKYLWLSHRGGDIVSTYVHLKEISTRLRIGTRVRSGEVIGQVGVTGLSRPVAHLHFGLSVRQRGKRRYVDPEPLLWSWPLPAELRVENSALRASALNSHL